MLLTLLVNRSMAFARGASNLLATSDAIVRAAILNRSTANSSSIADIGLSSQVLNRQTTDSKVTLDVPNEKKNANRVASDVQSILDTAARVAAILKANVEILTVSDSQSWMQILSRAASDSLTVSDIGARIPSLNRLASDVQSILDAATKLATINRVISDTLSTADASARSQVVTRSVADVESTADTSSIVKSLNKFATDFYSITDNASRVDALNRSAFNVSSISDLSVGSQSLSRAASDVDSIFDSITLIRSLNKGVTDSLSTFDNSTRTEALLRNASDGLNTVDSSTRSSSVTRTASDADTTTDYASEAQSLRKTTSDSSFTTDGALRTFGGSRQASDILATADASGRLFVGLRSASNILSTSDGVAIQRGYFRGVGDVYSTSDTGIQFVTHSRTASDILSISDSATKFIIVNRGASDVLSTVDAAGRVAAFQRFANNSLFTSDVATTLGHRVSDPITTPGTTGSPYLTPKFSSATTPGSINKKYVIFYGLMSPDLSTQVLVPKGTFIATTAAGSVTAGKNVQTLHGFDVVKQFNFPVYSDFPHPLYGKQNDIRYDANYNLKNPSSDRMTYVCDAKKFMTGLTDNAFFSSNYTNIFGAVSSGSPVNVFVGLPSVPATVPVSAATYTWIPDTGTVIFTSAQAANAVVSVDGIPQAMAPEMMMQHLFVDYAQWDPNYLKFDKSNTLIPTYAGGRGSSIWQIAQDIAAQTAPRGVRWQIRVDEYGVINFYEARIAATPVAVLTDERDLFNIQYTLTSEQLVNVVTADSVSNTNQPLKSVSYDVPSITEDGQRSPFAIPSNLLLATRGYNSGTGISLMNTLTASELYERSKPTLELSCNIVPNYLLQVGDKVTIQEQALGLGGPYIIKGIDDAIRSGNKGEMTLRMSKAHIFANMNMGLPSAVTNAMNQTSANMTNSLAGKTGIISSVTINGLAAISSGTTAKDYLGNAVIPLVSPTSSWSFAVSIDPSQGYDTVMEHYVYFECANTLFTDTAMAFRMPGIVSGTVITAATITGGYTATGTHSTGTMTNGGVESTYKYSNLVISAVASSLPAGYNGSFGTVNNVTNAQQYLGSTSTYGLGLGPSYLGSYAYLPNQKQNYGYLVIQAANSNGAFSFLRVPFILQL